jgi:energy-coupling factor transport system permease protein
LKGEQSHPTPGPAEEKKNLQRKNNEIPELEILKGKVFQKWRTALTYTPGDSFIHGLNPMTKLGILVLFTGTALAFREIIPGVVLWSAVLAAALLSGLILPLFRGYLIMIPFIVFVVVTDAFFAGPETGIVLVSFQAGMISLKLVSGRLIFALAMGFRLLSLSGIGILFVITTSYTAFVRALQSTGLPATFAFSLGTAFRTMSILAEDASRIMDAQRSRGMEFDRDLVTKNRNKVTAVTIPMAVTILRRSRTLTAAMESRGFSSALRPSIYRKPHFSKSDAFAIFAVCGVFWLAWLVSQYTSW